jgi:tRNA threonylcarbamoyladenosine biosynthesis protein TsaB
MPFLLAIESATKNCSVAIFENEKLLHFKEINSDEYLHAEKLTLFIEEVLTKVSFTLKKIDGIILSKGPGSYTGLRIGTSIAKGLCYSLEIPLISISSLKSMALAISNKKDYKFYCPMIDARRMEVFASIYDESNNEVREIRADVVDEFTYSEYLEDKVLFLGNGALKCRSIIKSNNASFIEIFPSAKDFGVLGFEKFVKKDFEDLAYYEPYYLKDFVPGVKKRRF